MIPAWIDPSNKEPEKSGHKGGMMVGVKVQIGCIRYFIA